MPRGHYPHPLRRSLSDRFWEKVQKSDGCWTWVGCRDKRGYGRIGKGRREDGVVLAHRVSWELHNGEIPPGLEACHKCDNPPCVNPDHIFLGTHWENADDMSAKGRQHGQQQTHCKRGHEFTPENTYPVGLRGRGCRECKRTWYLRRKQAA